MPVTAKGKQMEIDQKEVTWNYSATTPPPSNLVRVLVCYAGIAIGGEEDGYIEITRAEYVRDEPHLYPFWMELPKPQIHKA